VIAGAATTIEPEAPADESLADKISSLPQPEREQLLGSLSEQEMRLLEYDWHFWRRPKQTPPPWDWLVWLLLTGRGFGKSWTGANWILEQARNGSRHLALIGRTAADVRDVQIEGPSGVMSLAPPWFRPKYEPSKRRVTFPNGATATAFSSEEPSLLRGPQHEKVWADEVASWRYVEETWDNMMLGLRLGMRPQVVATTTPRPIKLIKSLIADSRKPNKADRTVHVTTGSTYENLANLAPSVRQLILSKYEGTRLGRQEIHGALLEDAPGALWKRELIDKLRVSRADVPALRRVIVAVDPAVSSNKNSNETGIIVAGLGENDHGYILGDHSLLGTPNDWAKAVCWAYANYLGDRVVGEVNNGGDLVEVNVRTVDPSIPYKAVRASRGKYTRAEPVASLYEQEKVHHVGLFSELEDQMCTWEPGEDSPDRMDASVWALTELMLGDEMANLSSLDDVVIGSFTAPSIWKQTSYGVLAPTGRGV
jgi:phage terminase large subunit-like protein